MADTPAAIGIRFAFRQYMDLWHCYQLAAMLLLPSTSWRPATAGCCGGFIFRRYLLFLFGGIFGLLLRELLSLSRVVLSSHCTELYLGFPPTPACSLVRECSDWGVSAQGSGCVSSIYGSLALLPVGRHVAALLPVGRHVAASFD